MTAEAAMAEGASRAAALAPNVRLPSWRTERRVWQRSRGRVRLLQEDSDLLACIPDDEQAPATTVVTCSVGVALPRGWASLAEDPAVLGYYVLSGHLLVRSNLDGPIATVLGQGDVLLVGGQLTPPETQWWVRGLFSPGCEIACLGPRVAAACRRWPSLLAEIEARSAAVHHFALSQMEVVVAARATDRVYRLLWHLGQRWGIVTSLGLRFDMTMRHSDLALLAGLSRTRTTAAVNELRATGALLGGGRSWTLLIAPADR